MKYTALATDYDGTIAHGGKVDGPTLAALRRAAAAGVKLILVTGREVRGMYDVFDHVEVFDRVVAENGGVLYTPATRITRRLAAAPPAELVAELRRNDIPIGVGESVVSTYEPHGRAMHEAIAKTKVDWHVVMNKGAVMALPPGVDKASGLIAAVADLGLSPATVVAVGDAENDTAMLRSAGLGVAVANALETVKADAAVVTAGDHGAGVAELIARMLADDLPAGKQL